VTSSPAVLESQEPSEASDELAEFVGLCEDAVGRTYGTAPLLFEHGSTEADESSGGCCVTHAHLHVVPVRQELLQDDELGAFRPLSGFGELLHARITSNYLLYKGRDQQFRISDTEYLEYVTKLGA